MCCVSCLSRVWSAASLTRPQRSSPINHQDLLASVAPKRANWDLKRELQPKLDKLERRTLRAIVEIVQQEERRRLEEEGGAAD